MPPPLRACLRGMGWAVLDLANALCSGPLDHLLPSMLPLPVLLVPLAPGRAPVPMDPPLCMRDYPSDVGDAVDNACSLPLENKDRARPNMLVPWAAPAPSRLSVPLPSRAAPVAFGAAGAGVGGIHPPPSDGDRANAASCIC